MTAIECLKVLRTGFLVLLVWNLLITGCLIAQFSNKQETELNQQICSQELIPLEVIEEEF